MTRSRPPAPVPAALSFAEPLPLPGFALDRESPRLPLFPGPADVPFARPADAPAHDNPFLTPVASAQDGGPPSLLPPPTTNRGSVVPSAIGATVPPPLAYPFGKSRQRGRGWWIAAAALALAGVAYWQRGTLAALAGGVHGGTASLLATSSQPGVHLSVDGRDVGALPVAMHGLKPGEHVVAFEGERYAPEKTTIELAPGETRTVSPVSLKVSKGAARFQVEVGNVSLALIAADEQRRFTDYSRPIDIDNSKSWMLEASKPGFATVRMPIVFDREPEKTFTISFSEPDSTVRNADHVANGLPVGNSPLAAVLDETAAPVGGVDLATLPRDGAPKRRKRGARAAYALRASEHPANLAATKAAAPAGSCTLNINSIPASTIALDGRPLGMTPKLNVPASAGPHTITFSASAGRKSAATSCIAGEHKTVALRL